MSIALVSLCSRARTIALSSHSELDITQLFQPAEAGFVCVDANSIRPDLFGVRITLLLEPAEAVFVCVPVNSANSIRPDWILLYS